MSQQSIYTKTINVMNQIWNTQDYDFDMPTIYTAHPTKVIGGITLNSYPGGVFHSGKYYTNVSKYGDLYTESSTSTITAATWSSDYVYVSAPTVIMPDWVENWWQGELYAEYYIYHELAHAINSAEGNSDSHAANFHVVYENIVKDAIVAGDLPENALTLFEAYEESYSNNYGEIVSQEFIAEIRSDLKDAEDDMDAATNLVELRSAAEGLDDIATSLVIETELNDLQSIVDAGNLWIEENNPFEADSFRADRWESIKEGSFDSEVSPYLLDLNQNGEVQIDDIIDILRDIVGLEELSDSEFVLADANRDGVLDISDAIAGLQVIVDLTTIDEVAADAFVPSLDFA